ELHQVFDSRPFRVDSRLLNAFGIDIDSNTFGAEIAGGGDYDAPIAAAEIINRIAFCDVRKPQQTIYYFIGARDIRHIGCMLWLRRLSASEKSERPPCDG